MKLDHIELVITDMDGTLLNSKHELSSDFDQIFKKLQSLNIRFVAASGRPFYSITEKLKDYNKDILIAAENGGLVVDGDKELYSNGLTIGQLKKIDQTISGIENAHCIYCTKNKAFIKNTSEELVKIFAEFYGQYEIIDTIDAIDAEVLKVATYHQVSAEQYIYPKVRHFEKHFKVKVSANHWVDISDLDTNKGKALDVILEKYAINPENVLAFGDYNNDLEMLEKAGSSVAMANAHPHVLSCAKYQTGTNDEAGVERILLKMIEQKTEKN